MLLFLVGGLLWTLLSSYPNPLIFFRNLARYRRLPIDPRLAQRMRWQVPQRVGEMETFVDGLLIPTTDWQLYRVPWYVATPLEAARAGAGDCEARTVILASLLRGKGIPFQVRASFSHIWVDYPGRLPLPGETSVNAYLTLKDGRWDSPGPPPVGQVRDLPGLPKGTAGRQGPAYLTLKDGRWDLRWPPRVRWRQMLAAREAQLWDPMPGVRKALWIYGLVWLALALLVSGRPSPAGDLVSDWRAPWRPYLARAAVLSALTLVVMALAAGLSQGGQWEGIELKAPLREVLAYFAVLGGLLAWLSLLRARTAVAINPEGTHLVCRSLFAGIRRERNLPVSSISHLTLETSPGGLRPWVVAAMMTGKPASGRLLLRYRGELSARAALRRLGSRLGRPIVVRCEGAETRTEPEEIGVGLRQRAPCRAGTPIPASQQRTSLHMSDTEEGWELGYSPLPRGASGTLLGCAAVPVAITALATALLVYVGDLAPAKIIWALATFLLALTTYLALVLRDEFLARLARTRVEIVPCRAGAPLPLLAPSIVEGSAVEGSFRVRGATEGIPAAQLRFHSPEGKVETVRLADIETIEPGRVGETPTIAVVTPERVLHMAGLGQPEEREWVMGAVRSAIARFTGGQRSCAPLLVDKPVPAA